MSIDSKNRNVGQQMIFVKNFGFIEKGWMCTSDAMLSYSWIPWHSSHSIIRCLSRSLVCIPTEH